MREIDEKSILKIFKQQQQDQPQRQKKEKNSKKRTCHKNKLHNYKRLWLWPFTINKFFKVSGTKTTKNIYLCKVWESHEVAVRVYDERGREMSSSKFKKKKWVNYLTFLRPEKKYAMYYPTEDFSVFFFPWLRAYCMSKRTWLIYIVTITLV